MPNILAGVNSNVQQVVSDMVSRLSSGPDVLQVEHMLEVKGQECQEMQVQECQEVQVQECQEGQELFGEECQEWQELFGEECQERQAL